MKTTTTLTLNAEDVPLLLSVISFASESDLYVEDDAQLDRLYRRLEAAGIRLAAVAIGATRQ